MKIDLRELPVVFINLEEDAAKRTAIMELLVSLGFKTIARSPGFLPGKDYKIKVSAVSKAHSEALKVFKPPFIVVEDDIEAASFLGEIEVPDTADAVSLGNMQWAYTHAGWEDYPDVSPAVHYPDLYQVNHMVGGHAWVYLTESFVQKMQEVCTWSFSQTQYILAQDCKASRDLYPHSEVYVIGAPMFTQAGKYREVTDKHVTEYRARQLPGFVDFFKKELPPASSQG